MGQFSRFMRPGDVRIDASSTNTNLLVVATKDSANKSSIVVINDRGEDYTTTVDGLDSNIASIYRTSANEDIACLGSQASNKLYPTDDAYIRNGTFGDTNFSIDATLQVKRQSYVEEPNYAKKALLKFNISYKRHHRC